jgi:hypothetical protein
VAITEGEIDAMTLHQVGIPALSVNAGAGNHQWIETTGSGWSGSPKSWCASTTTRPATRARPR